MNNNILYLGEKSYPSIVNKIYQKFQNTKPDTMVGQNAVTEFLLKLNESITPIMDLKDFSTNAEKVAPNDTKLSEILDFAKAEVKTGDLNFLINLAKEEHFIEMSRTGMPSPETTIKEIESLFNEPSSIIEQGIKNGLFTTLKSNIYMEIETMLGDKGTKNKIINPKDKSLNESENVLYSGNLIMYNPVAIRLEDVKNNRILMLTESTVLTYDKNNEIFMNLNESDLNSLNIPNESKRLMTAISSLQYNPENQTFSLNESWDFDLSIDKSGDIILKKDKKQNKIDKNDLTSFLMESINYYESISTNPNFNKFAYSKDADDFIMLVENHNNIILLDEIHTIRNLNENSYVIVNRKENSLPVLISSSDGPKLFENYSQLVNSAETILNESIGDIFNNQLKFETDFYQQKQIKIQKLNENQKEINLALKDIKNLKDIAETDSPAMENLNESENQLNEKLNENIKNLDFYVNKINPYTTNFQFD